MKVRPAQRLSPGQPAGKQRGWLRFWGRRSGGPSPAECLIPQMQDREHRKRYQSRDVATRAPSKLIGYVSAGSVECPREAFSPRRKPRGRFVVWGLAMLLAILWLGFGGAFALFGLLPPA